MPRPRLSLLASWVLSLKGRLLLGLATTWMVVVALVMWAGWVSGRSLMEESNLTHLRYEARLIDDDLTHQVDARLNALERLAERIEGLSRRGRDAHEVLDANAPLLEWFDGLLLIDAEGIVQADWPHVSRREGTSVAARDYFRFVRGFKQPHVSEPFIGYVTEEPLILFVVPILDETGTFQGAVGGLVNILNGGLFEQLSRLRLGDDGYAAIATASGRILYHPRETRILQPLPPEADNPWVNLARLGWEGETLGPALDGQPAFQAFRQIWPAGWIVGVYLLYEQVMAPIHALFRRLGGMEILIALLLLPLMGWLVWLALRPLYRLERQIEALGQGQRGRIALSTRMHELQRIGDTLNAFEAARSRALAELRDREAFLDAVLAESPVGMFVTDAEGAVVLTNAALREIVGRSGGGRRVAIDWLADIHPEDRALALERWRYSLRTGEDFLRQFRYRRAGSELLWLEVHATRVTLDGETVGRVGMVKDITERREQEMLRLWEAEHDPLTGLLNRRGFERRLEEALVAWQKAGTPAALLLLDLDHFKPINDQGGHALGDEMLQRIAETLTREVRISDYVARQGGDEFAVLLPGCSAPQALAIAEALREAVAAIGVSHAGREYRVTLSVGVTSLMAGDRQSDEVIARADAASYQAKRSGRNAVISA
ncbi:diguanylate cyclase [Halomonas cerina]|uniref:Diguanylate cyclase (GGDEF)-like protein/PAS domain S-box-containing protein n=1 Tax=Halomonas cerina TaxID=447424 RepID=A0A839V5I3_9GAMM|nr:diguanylate cyclase (GGDEF)-like protein/PAS domain S-box-containing protein [Halomonas cerina]